MTSIEPLRSRAYHEDLRWRIVYQKEMLDLPNQQIASNLCVDESTVWRTIKRFYDERNVDPIKNKGGYHKLSNFEKIAILEAVVEKPSIYLKEICMHIDAATGTVVSPSAVCRFLKSNNFSRKKLSNVARQRNLELRKYFIEECEAYTPEMMVFVDETVCDRRSSMRAFGKGTCVTLCP